MTNIPQPLAAAENAKRVVGLLVGGLREVVPAETIRITLRIRRTGSSGGWVRSDLTTKAAVAAIEEEARVAEMVDDKVIFTVAASIPEIVANADHYSVRS